MHFIKLGTGTCRNNKIIHLYIKIAFYNKKILKLFVTWYELMIDNSQRPNKINRHIHLGRFRMALFFGRVWYFRLTSFIILSGEGVAALHGGEAIFKCAKLEPHLDSVWLVWNLCE